MKGLWKDERGLTLVEVVVAMLLLSIGILTSVTLLAAGIKVNDINRDRSLALNLAEQRMEYWKYRDLASVSRGISPAALEEYDTKRGSVEFHIGVTATPVSQSGLVKLEVVVSWPAHNNNGGDDTTARTVSLVTLRPF